MRRVADTVLGSLASMRDDELFCHPNTVRQRLGRLEERTGRSLADPLDLTHLCLALEADRRLVDPG